MTVALPKPEQLLQAWARTRGIQVSNARLRAGKGGEFDGKTIVMNSDYGEEERVYYLVHALGSIAIWSSGNRKVQDMFDELREAKKEKASAPERLERAIERYRVFETQSSEHAVWLLGNVGCLPAIPSYTNFMRADLECMTEFHRTGTAPVWQEFLADWNKEVRSGRIKPAPFVAKPIPDFDAVQIEKQEILQQQ
jgi:hypothetical protein